MSAGIYIHIPFCVKKCSYCDFYSIPYNDVTARSYLEALIKEIASSKYHPSSVDTIYIGGGTPSLFKPGEISAILNAVSKSYSIASSAEISMEINPGTVKRKILKEYKDIGINRLSIGVQSLNDEALRLLGRIHTAEEARTTIRDAGLVFQNLSVDLIYGIPGQGRNVFENTLREVLSYQPKHLSCYELTLERGTPLYNLVQRGFVKLKDDLEVEGEYFFLLNEIEKHGFIHYEISNYALPGYQCRHNLKYWQREEYLGFGASAHSFYSNRREENISDVHLYIKGIQSNKPVRLKSQVLTLEDSLKERIFLGLRMKEGLSLEHIPLTTKKIHQLFGSEYIKVENNRISLTPRGMLLSNSILSKLFAIIEGETKG
ncbi:MAG: radical SAM family heme chaperone HemW [Nitrospirae bacterium]|nr:MAG: radical SAM family heme chaperone HemW [Nitrospirota bacterium]